MASLEIRMQDKSCSKISNLLIVDFVEVQRFLYNKGCINGFQIT